MGVSPVYNSTMAKYRINQIVYIVQSCREIRQMKVIKYSNGFYTNFVTIIRYNDTLVGLNSSDGGEHQECVVHAEHYGDMNKKRYTQAIYLQPGRYLYKCNHPLDAIVARSICQTFTTPWSTQKAMPPSRLRYCEIAT